MRRLKSNKNKGKGFTLVEALVAITVLTLALGGPMTLATRSIKDSLASRNKVTAFYLAHEAIEYVKNKRDSNFLYQICNSQAPPPLSCAAPIDWLDGQTSVIGSLNCSPLQFVSYSYSCSGSGNDSIFNRVITITNPDDTTPVTGNEIKVTVTVSWTDYGPRTVTLTQNMFNLAP